ncbi:MAG: ABC transporter permease [Oscillospiraceae bacterium]|nr:ABC transporter permease [Oscillospiraceae bacterium]
MSKPAKEASTLDLRYMARKRVLTLISPYFGLVSVVVLFYFTTDGRLLSSQNLQMVFNQMFPVFLLCLGAVFVWAHGAIDLSVGAAMGCAAIVAANLYNSGSVALSVFGAIFIALLFGLTNGLLSAVLKLPPFLATFCTMFIGTGIQAYFTLREVIFINHGVARWEATEIDSFPVKIVVIFVAAVVCFVLFQFTVIGKNNTIIGGNIKAARFSGIRVNRDRIIAFLISSVFVGLAAFFNVMRINSVTNTFGAGMQFSVIMSLVFGGMIIGGGKNARISAAIIGPITFILLSNGLQLSGIPTFYVSLLRGVFFIVIMAITFRKDKNELLPSFSINH